MDNEIKEIFNDINWLLKEAENNSRNSTPGYDEGWYNGECNAYEIVLEKLESVIKGYL